VYWIAVKPETIGGELVAEELATTDTLETAKGPGAPVAGGTVPGAPGAGLGDAAPVKGFT
jgi:hypothetical protein